MQDRRYVVTIEPVKGKPRHFLYEEYWHAQSMTEHLLMEWDCLDIVAVHVTIAEQCKKERKRTGRGTLRRQKRTPIVKG